MSLPWWLHPALLEIRGKIRVRISADARPGLDWQRDEWTRGAIKILPSLPIFDSLVWREMPCWNPSAAATLSALVWAANGARGWWTGHKHPMSFCRSAGVNNTQAMHLESCSGQSTRGSRDRSFIIFPIPGITLGFILLNWNSLHECLSGLGSRG